MQTLWLVVPGRFAIPNPVTTGKWRELSLYSLEIDFSIRWKLEHKKIKTLGELCECSFEQLTKIPEVGPEGAVKIKVELESMGISLGTGDAFDLKEDNGDGGDIDDTLFDLGSDEELPFN